VNIEVAYVDLYSKLWPECRVEVCEVEGGIALVVDGAEGPGVAAVLTYAASKNISEKLRLV
jgi:hypothetical protein